VQYHSPAATAHVNMKMIELSWDLEKYDLRASVEKRCMK